MHESRKPRYRFRVFTNGKTLHESDALAFDAFEEVWQEGAMTSVELIRDMYGRIEEDLDWRLEVSDDTGRMIYRFSFKAETL
jgi:hypothetical protein